MRVTNPPPDGRYTTRAAIHAVPSPCVAICTMNPDSDFCDGCQRTIDEIAGWSAFSNDEKRQVWVRIDQRRVRLVQDAANTPSRP